MNPLSKIGVWILVAATAALLPMYELADYTEVWAHDGDLILPALFFLFAGMAMLGGKLVIRPLLTTILSVISRVCIECICPPRAGALYDVSGVTPSPPLKGLALVLCDLRI